MEHKFWHDKWEQQQIGFHLEDVHPILKRHLDLFSSDKEAAKVFVPLCGKTVDIAYLLQKGYEVVAVELSEIAIQSLFESLELKPDVSAWAEDGKCYRAPQLTVFVGDYFKLSAEDLADISWVYDRAALIALPEKMRLDYAQHMAKITRFASQLLITLDYDQNIAGGPPFAVGSEEVEGLYGGNYPIQLLEEADIIESEPRFKAKGLSEFFQRAYRLK